MTLTTYNIHNYYENTLAKSDLAVLARISLSLHLILSFLPIVFIYCFTIESYNVFVTIEFFPHVIIMEDSLLMGPFDNDFGDVDTLFNL